MRYKAILVMMILSIVTLISKPALVNSRSSGGAMGNLRGPISNSAVNADACQFLIVDDDWDFDQTVENDGGRPYYTSALDLLGFIYDVWDTRAQGEPTATNLHEYSAVIWFTGFDWLNTLSPDNEIQMASYLDGGGNFVLSAEDYFADTGIITSFMQNYLGVDTITNDKNEIDVIGNASNPIGNNLGPYALVRPDDWAVYWPTDGNSGPYTDYVTAASGGSSPFRFNGSAKNNSTNKEGAGWKTVFLAWPFEWIDTPSQRADIMRNILTWTNPECTAKTSFLPFVIKD